MQEDELKKRRRERGEEKWVDREVRGEEIRRREEEGGWGRR